MVALPAAPAALHGRLEDRVEARTGGGVRVQAGADDPGLDAPGPRPAGPRTPAEAQGLSLRGSGLFRAEVKLPAVAPTGKYYAEVWLFQDGEPQSVSNLTLTVEKVGLERDIYEFAHRRPWLYGLLCVVLAALTGYGASRIFSRRS